MFEVVAWNGQTELVVDVFAEWGNANDRARELEAKDTKCIAYFARRAEPASTRITFNGEMTEAEQAEYEADYRAAAECAAEDRAERALCSGYGS
jgi:hypothetical protein